MPPGEWSRRKVFVVVRTYPSPAWNGIEVSCTAAITDTGEWMRLFPVPYRFLGADKRFSKYQWIEADIRRARGDSRPESHNIRGESIEIVAAVGPEKNWASRKDILYPLRAPSLCELKRGWERDKTAAPTLGLFKPKAIRRLVVEANSGQWTASELLRLRQLTLFDSGPHQELEKIPFTFKYQFTCDDADCRGHEVSCADWEIAQAYRAWKHKYGEGWEGKFRQRFESEMIEKNDTHFFMGTVHQHPGTWIIVGLFYPPGPVPGSNSRQRSDAATAQISLFD